MVRENELPIMEIHNRRIQHRRSNPIKSQLPPLRFLLLASEKEKKNPQVTRPKLSEVSCLVVEEFLNSICGYDRHRRVRGIELKDIYNVPHQVPGLLAILTKNANVKSVEKANDKMEQT